MTSWRRVTPRRLLTWLLLAVVLGQFVMMMYQLPSVGDFIAYWSGSRLTLTGGNAYDAEALHQLQIDSGWGQATPVRVWNPPWTPIILLPLGVLPLLAARALWAVTTMLLLWVSGYWLHLIFWPRATGWSRLVAILIPSAFVLVWETLVMGQISPLVVFGLSGALRYYRDRPLLAGSLIVLATVKPQICIGALLIFAVRAVAERAWHFVAGGVGTLAAAVTILTLLRPGWLGDYNSVLETPLLDWRTPTLASFLRELAPTAPIAPLFLALATIGILLLAASALRSGEWEDAVAGGVVVTLLFTVFAWDFDLIVLLIPLYHMLGHLRRNRPALIAVTATLMGLNALTYVMRLPGPIDRYYFFWVVPAFTLIYIGSLLWCCRTQPIARLLVEPDPVR